MIIIGHFGKVLQLNMYLLLTTGQTIKNTNQWVAFRSFTLVLGPILVKYFKIYSTQVGIAILLLGATQVFDCHPIGVFFGQTLVDKI